MKITYNTEDRTKSENDLDVILANLDPGKYVIEVKKFRNVRSNNQNAYYWAIIETVSNEIGESKEMTHELMCEKFAKKEVEVMGEVVVVKSTSSMDTLEFTNFLDNVLQFAEGFLSLRIPRPGDPAYSEWINLN